MAPPPSRHRPAYGVALFLLGLSVACSGGDSTTKRSGRPAVSIGDSVRARRNARLATRPDTMGARVDSLRIDGVPGASLFVIVVSDFQCSQCRAFAREVLPVIQRDYIQTGIARLAFVNAPQDVNFNARFAAHAALCAASAGKFWPMHDTVFATQSTWARREDPRPFFDSLAVAVGVDSTAQGRCTQRQPLLALLTADMERSASAGVTSVPTLIVGEERLSGPALTLPRIHRAIRAARR